MINFEKFCNDELINNVLYELKNELDGNKIFISEADLQFSFAKKLYELQDKNINNIILEYPITTEFLYSQAQTEHINEIKKYLNKRMCNSCKDKDDYCSYYCNKFQDKYSASKESIDLLFKYEDTYYFIEFKYKSDKIKDSVCRYSDILCNEFYLKMHGADDLGRYSVYEDLERLENIKKVAKTKNAKCKAFIIFITNHKAYWSLNQTEGKLASNMPLATGDKYNSIKYTKNGELYFGNENNATKRRTLFVENQYELHWNNFKTLDKTIENTLFKCLVIEL